MERYIRNMIKERVIYYLKIIYNENFDTSMLRNTTLLSFITASLLTGFLYSNRLIKGKFLGILSYSLINLVIFTLLYISINLYLNIQIIILSIPSWIWIIIIILSISIIYGGFYYKKTQN